MTLIVPQVFTLAAPLGVGRLRRVLSSTSSLPEWYIRLRRRCLLALVVSHVFSVVLRLGVNRLCRLTSFF